MYGNQAGEPDWNSKLDNNIMLLPDAMHGLAEAMKLTIRRFISRDRLMRLVKYLTAKYVFNLSERCRISKMHIKINQIIIGRR